MIKMRVGFGCDTHRLEPESGGSVVVCGVPISTDYKLIAHSDGDVGLHALADAILGACALGDIGEHFPPSDPKWKDRDSRFFVEHTMTLLKNKGGVVSNADITVISQNIKLGALKMDMRIAIAEMLGVSVDDVSIKAKTAEQMGALGRGEGIGAYAVVSVMFLPQI